MSTFLSSTHQLKPQDLPDVVAPSSLQAPSMSQAQRHWEGLAHSVVTLVKRWYSLR